MAAPVLDPSLFRSAIIIEDEVLTFPAGALYYANATDSRTGVTDDFTLQGVNAGNLSIAISDVAGILGNVEFSTDNGFSWNAAATINPGQAAIYTADTLLRYTPTTDAAGLRAVTFYAFDGDAATYPSGTVVSIATEQGLGTMSIDSTVHTLFIAPAFNDPLTNLAPYLLSDTVRESSTLENQSVTVDGFAASFFTDASNGFTGAVDDDVMAKFDGNGVPHFGLGVAIIGVSGVTGGLLQYSTNNGVTWNTVPADGSTPGALLFKGDTLINYTPPPGEFGPRIITFRAWDGTGPYNSGDFVDLATIGAGGGDSPFSAETATHTLNITNLTEKLGDAANNIIIGSAGSDLIDGLAGADTMIGGLGDDIYIVDNIGDDVVEDSDIFPVFSDDTVKSSITYTLV